MSKFLRLLLGWIAAAVCFGQTGIVTRVALTLTDGSRLLGVCRAETVPVEWQGQSIALRPSLLRRIQIGSETNSAHITFANGDQMRAVLRLKTFPVETLFGTQEIQVEIVRVAEFFALRAAGAPFEDGLLLYYSFDNVTGNRVPDLSGNGNDGVIHGAELAEGKIGWGMKFRRKTDRVEVKEIPGLKFGPEDDATLALWWKTGSDIEHAPLLSNVIAEPTGFVRGFSLLVLASEGYYTPLFVHCAAKHRATFEKDTWHFVAVVKKGKVWRVSHNGNLCALTGLGDWPAQKDVTVSAPFLIGGCVLSDWPPFDGCIDEVRIYRRALSAEEIRRLFERQ